MKISALIIALISIGLLISCSNAPKQESLEKPAQAPQNSEPTIKPGTLVYSQLIGVWVGTEPDGTDRAYILWEDLKASESIHPGLQISWNSCWKIDKGNFFFGGIDEELGTGTPVPNLVGELRGDELHLTTPIRDIFVLKRVRSVPPPYKASKEVIRELEKDIRKVLTK